MMKFWGMGGSFGLEPMAKKKFLKTSLVQKKVILLKHKDRACGQKELPCKYGGDSFIESGEIKSRGSFQGDFHMLKTYWRPTYCQAKVVFPPSKTLILRQ